MVTSHALLISVSSFSRASLRYNERPKPVLGVVGYPILGLPTRPPHNASALSCRAPRNLLAEPAHRAAPGPLRLSC